MLVTVTEAGGKGEALPQPVFAAPVTPEAFAPFGELIQATESEMPFGAGDALLDLARGQPRLYIMKLAPPGLVFRQITRHRQVTQCLGALGGKSWLLAVAPPHDVDDPAAEPAPEDIRGFLMPGDVAIKLHRGTWHAGPLFEGEAIAFLNLELSDTNERDHHDSHLDRRFGHAFRLVPPA